MASYRETKYGWRAEIFRRGIRRSESGFRTKAAAVAWAGKLESEIMAGLRGEVPNHTLQALLTKYKNEVSKEKKGRRWEEIRLDLIGRDKVALVRLRQLDTPHVADWQQRRLQDVSAASVRRERNLLNNVFEIARKEWHWLVKNPFLGVRRPKDGKPRKRIASPVELDRLTRRASDRMGRIIVWAVETGMRAGEIALLEDVKGRVAYIYDSKNNESREVPLSKRALGVWVEGGFGLTVGSISAIFARLCEEAKIEGLTFHDLRATACTRLAKKLNPLQLAKMMGWKDLKHAMVYYREATADIAKLL